MFSETITPHLKFHLSIRNKLQCLHYTWNSEQNKITPLHKNRTAQTFILLNIAYSLCQIAVVATKSATFTLTDQIKAVFFVCIYLCGLGFCQWSPSLEYIQLINTVQGHGHGLINQGIQFNAFL